MAQRVTVSLEDDVDGSAAQEQITFALEGSEYEIDLSTKNAEALRAAMAPWVGHARKITRRRSAKASNTGASAGEIREWAMANGVEVNARGRVPADVREAFANANK